MMFGRVMWQGHGVISRRRRVTVDVEILRRAQQLNPALTTAELLDHALSALISEHNTAVDAAYAVAYDTAPLNVPDELGSLDDFRTAASSR